MSEKIGGSCICGDVTFQVVDDFAVTKLCFCRFCQKASGSAHVSNAFGDPAGIQWLSGEENLAEFNVPNSMVRRVFCKTCGTSLPFVSQNDAFLVVPIGSLERPLSTRPSSVASWNSRPNWYDEALQMLNSQSDT